MRIWYTCCVFFFFQAEDGIRDLVRSRGLGDVYKRQDLLARAAAEGLHRRRQRHDPGVSPLDWLCDRVRGCLLYTSDAADERSSVDLGGRRIIKKKNTAESVAAGEQYGKKTLL